MSDIEKEEFRQIGIDLINEYRVRGGLKPIDWLVIDTPEVNAFIRSIQLHEKTKKGLADFRQEVSDAVTALLDCFLGDDLSQGVINGHLHQFIIRKPKPDPLEEVLQEIDHAAMWVDECAKEIRAALEARGLEIREKGK